MKPDLAKGTTYTSLEPIKVTAPTIKFTKNAIKWLTYLADLHEHEVGCFGFVDELPDNTYLIRDIFYPKHCEANGATCEISPEGETLMAEWLINKNRENDLAKVRFWGHSHVNMGVFASGQDETQSLERMERTQSYFIRGIFNKAGLMSISFFDYTNKRRFDNIKWETDYEDDDVTIRTKILELKKTHIPEMKTCLYPNYQGGDHMYNDGDPYWKTRFNNGFQGGGREFHPPSAANNFGKKGKRNRSKNLAFEFAHGK
jgi:hypothetical protein